MTKVLVFLLFILMNTMLICNSQLSPSYYDDTCPNVLSTIRTSIRQAVSRERRMAASIIRLHFHDCFVQGCDASILLSEEAVPDSERTALQNNNSARGFEVIDDAKVEVEKVCPGVVSCADILAVAARDASVAVGGPSWTIKLGRRDSTTSSRSEAEDNLPRFTNSLQELIDNFDEKNLNVRDLVALSGAHTIGQAQCVTYRGRIYDNTSDIDAGFASTRQRGCPNTVGDGDKNLAPLDLVTPNSFDNNYFKNLVQKKGLIASDQILFSGQETDSIVNEYSNDPAIFKADFANAMVKMGDISPRTGDNGIIRRVCSILA
ncbi:lignin-forming anionic peroxidase-like [Impatiens glandulifera]|uniref:lignin-forming anionic peroxidase-like n=1 Tax=Impatiens glandulifera TaxID=253017 RepID=UPI001FB051F3|nr:lignin-forming anionic peroxidase-like [Impatiens glandulifera]